MLVLVHTFDCNSADLLRICRHNHPNLELWPEPEPEPGQEQGRALDEVLRPVPDWFVEAY